MFSLILFFNRQENRKKLNSFFLKLPNLIASQQDIEIIFVLNLSNIFILDKINEFQKKYKDLKIKFLFSTKEKKFDNCLDSIMSLITNEYVIFLDENITILDNNFLSDIEKILNNEQIDIIEFLPKINGIFEWKPKNLRIDNNLINVKINIEDNKQIVPFSYPFIFNKIIQSDLLEKTVNNFKYLSIKSSSSLIFSQYIYLIFIEAKTYQLIPKKYFEFYLLNESFSTYNNILDIWNNIQNVFKTKNYLVKEIEYAKLFYLKFIIPSLLSKSINKKPLIFKNNYASQKYENKLNDIISSEYNNFDILNNYMLFYKNKEVNLIKKNYPISKWDKILKDIE